METPQQSESARRKALVRRLVDEVLNGGDLAVLEQIAQPHLAAAARSWIEPFLDSFPDVQMRIVELIAEGDTVVGRFTCSATHTGEWQARAPSGRRFDDVAEVSFFRFEDGLISSIWSLEDDLDRLRQLGLQDLA